MQEELNTSATPIWNNIEWFLFTNLHDLITQNTTILFLAGINILMVLSTYYFAFLWAKERKIFEAELEKFEAKLRVLRVF